MKKVTKWAQMTMTVTCYDHAQLRLTEWDKHKNYVVSDTRWQVECWLDCESVELTLSKLSQFFESQLTFYIERIISLMKMIMFNSIQVINYWFTLHCALRLLYQQAQIFSPNIQGSSDQNITHSQYWKSLNLTEEDWPEDYTFWSLSQVFKCV